MTKEEVIKELEFAKLTDNYMLHETVNAAIEMLKQESCEDEDIISRENVLTALKADPFFTCSGDQLNAIRIVESMPPTTPKQKTGKWIYHSGAEGFKYERTPYECSCCNKFERETSNFCPRCGIKMESEVENDKR